MVTESGIASNEDHSAKPGNSFKRFEKKPNEQSIVGRFEEQVRIRTDKIATRTMRDESSYRQLNQHANQRARFILQNSEK